jgi:SpoVK/Ycf46/Vps4 family AAA+-type ATPase
LNTVIHWKNSEKWFKSKHLPYKLGALLTGKPGTGKSSFVKAMAQEVDLPIEIFDLTTFTNEDMIRYWGQLKERAPVAALFEDIDRLFDEKGRLLQNQEKYGGPSLTLDCLLNCISGVLPSDGILTIATANFPERLDPALTRPGRLDREIVFKDLDGIARRTLAERILSDCPEFIEHCIAEGTGETGAQFTKRCGDLAVKHFWESGKNKTHVSKPSIWLPGPPPLEKNPYAKLSKSLDWSEH